MSSSFLPSLHSMYLANRIQYPLACVKYSAPERLINQAISHYKPRASQLCVLRLILAGRRVRYAMIDVSERHPLYTDKSARILIVSSPMPLTNQRMLTIALSYHVAAMISAAGVLPHWEASKPFS